MSDYGVRHPGGLVSVHITGQPFISREQAELEAAECDAGNRFGHCEQCGEDAGLGKHEVVSRQVGLWQ